jgi:hypothetical protein
MFFSFHQLDISQGTIVLRKDSPQVTRIKESGKEMPDLYYPCGPFVACYRVTFFNKMRNYSICPIINGISDHDAQIIKLPSFNPEQPSVKHKRIREITELTINDFLEKLSYETWETVFSTEDVNKMFNSFLDSYLKIFNSSFPLKRVYLAKKKYKLDHHRD